jgi:hypothetical protein
MNNEYDYNLIIIASRAYFQHFPLLLHQHPSLVSVHLDIARSQQAAGIGHTDTHTAKAQHPAARQPVVRWRDDPKVGERACLLNAEIVVGAVSSTVARASLVVTTPAQHDGSGMEKQWKVKRIGLTAVSTGAI